MRLVGPFLAGLFLLASAGAQGTPPLFEELARTHLPRSDGHSSAVVVGDVNGDGHPDLVFGAMGAADRLYFGDGEGGFVEAPAGSLPANVYDTRAVALADVNGNGHLDLIKGLVGQNRLYLNDGRGRFSEATQGRLPVEADHTYAVALADVNGNGHLDLVAGNIGQSRLYLNDGKGYFSRAPLPAPASNTRAVAFGDVDGDGHVDLVIASYGEPAVLMLNDGQGGFSDATAGRLQTVGALAAALADLNGNGHLDLILSRGVFLNDGRGFFHAATQFPMDFAYQVKAIGVGDVDGDQAPDLVLGLIPLFPHRIGHDQLYLNRGNGLFVPASDWHTPRAPDSTSGLALVDVNRNGRLDLVKSIIGPDRLYLNDGQGRFSDSWERALPEPEGRAWEIHHGDLDGDGWPDLALLSGFGIRILLDKGWGSMRDATEEKLPVPQSTYVSTLALADVSGNGLPDLFVGGGRPGFILSLYLNRGPGTFQDATATHLPALPQTFYVQRVRAVDVDGDGHLDLIVAFQGGQDRLLLNDGQGRFSDATAGRLPARASRSLDIAVADVDGDGHLDLIFGDADGDRLYLGDGQGNFSDATAGRLPAGTSGRLHVLDATGNGAPDLLAIAAMPPFLGPASGSLRLLVNDGKGHFTEAVGALPVLAAMSLVAADLTGNGAVDLALGTIRGVVLLENDGKGRFRDVTGAWLPGGHQDAVGALALFDRDGDGDLDLFAGSFNLNQNRFFTNLRRQLHAPRRLQVGAAFLLEIWGRPGEVAQVLVGGTPGDLELFPFGRLRLGTSGLFTAAFVPIVQEPKVVLPVRVPADPALRGLEVRFQALMIAPGAPTASRFTGVLVESGL